MKEIEITYVTEDLTPSYAKAIRAAKSREALVKAIEPYKRVADDALAVVQRFTAKDFSDFKRDIKSAAKKMPDEWVKKFNERFGSIAMPAKMMIASLLASEYHAPWGTAVIRCEEEKWPMLK